MNDYVKYKENEVKPRFTKEEQKQKALAKRQKALAKRLASQIIYEREKGLMKKLFTEWILEQTDRNDPIGDLARDVASDSCGPMESADYEVWLSHLETRGACTGAKDALKAAWFEYIDFVCTS